MRSVSSLSFAQLVMETMSGSRLAVEEEFIQHGNTSCLLHSIAVAYFCYCFFLSKNEENLQKLWFAFILAYVLVSTEQLGTLWQMMQQRAGVL